MRITLPRDTQRRLCRKQYVEIKTSFVTDEGPAPGTVWFDTTAPECEPLIVEEVCRTLNRVLYAGGPQDSLGGFLDYVREGRYVLIGVVPAPASYTVT